MHKSKHEFYEYLNTLLRDYPYIKFEDVISLIKLRNQYKIGKYRLLNWLEEYLEINFGTILGNKIKEKL